MGKTVSGPYLIFFEKMSGDGKRGNVGATLRYASPRILKKKLKKTLKVFLRFAEKQ
jgi:hypothetical protein